MGRREARIEPDGSALVDLAIALRDLRGSKTFTYLELSKATHYSIAALHEACSGRSLPSQAIVRSIVEACDSSWTDWEAGWHAAHLEKHGNQASMSPTPAGATAGSLCEERARDIEVTEAQGEARESGAERSPLNQEPVAQPRPPRRRAKIRVVGLVAGVGGLLLWAMWPTSQADPVDARSVNGVGEGLRSLTFREQAYSRYGSPTFLDPSGLANPGPKVPFETYVTVSCKVFAPSIPSVYPDGYWYRIADHPWDDRYFAAANTFLNGDDPSGPYKNNTDFDVPDC